MNPHVLLSNTAQSWLRFSPWFFALGLLFWWSSFSFLGLGIDQETALFREDQRGWLSQGRWFIFLFTQYLYPQPVLVYFPHVVFVLCMVLSYLLLLRAFAVSFRQRWWALLIFPVFMAHPVWYFIAEFAANLVPTALGMVAVAVAVWLFKQPPRLKNIVLQMLLLCLALGSYQSLIFVAYVLYAGLLVQHYYKEHSLQGLRSLKPFMLMVLIMAGSLVVNALLLKTMYVLFQTGPSYIHNHINLEIWLHRPVKALESYFKNVFRFYTGDVKAYQSTLFASGLVILTALVLFYKQIKPKPRRLRLLLWLLVISILAVPITPQILVVVTTAPYRTYLAVAMTLWLASAYVLHRLQHSRYIALAVTGVLLLNVQILHLHARYDSAKQFLYQHDQQVALQLYERILQLIPDYNPKQHHALSVYGPIDYTAPYGGLSSTLLSGSFFSWDNGSAYRVALYMRSQNYKGLQPVDAHTQQELLPIYQTMPSWPAANSVQLHNNIIMVKFSDDN